MLRTGLSALAATMLLAANVYAQQPTPAVYHSLADKTDQKKPLLKRILHRS